ncbi:MAG: aminopeptidase [Dehalococcoides mccartyi]|uniref:aminopeptidase n=1 Tax=Dehalococcoides mccartyi TaxID=61435 RepID=UPI0025C88904|nr:aminopeptidase [Dehalococcoides mccartyi]MDN4185598.1 aminopeptidase [Dehalococcoides mccartyi]
MVDPRTEKLADLLVNYSIEVKPGDTVAVNYFSSALPLAVEVYKKILAAGGHPLMQVSKNEFLEYLLKYGSDEQISYVHFPQRYITEHYDATIHLLAEENTKSMTSIDPRKMVAFEKARTDLMETSMRRTAEGNFRWVLAIYPTNGYAQDAGMSLEEYTDFVYNACLPDMNDPVGFWKNLNTRQQKVVDWLKGKKQVHIKAKETDLRLSIEGRTFVSCDGKLNMPDGEIFTGPVEDSAEGYVYFSYPAIEAGREVTGIRLWFEKGKVVKATAETNEEFLLKTLDTDPGARYLGEFAIGTSEGIQKFTKQILFDEKIGGSFHLACGAGYPETGSVNKSAVHWDMVCDLRDGGEIWVDGELLYKNGKFVIDY